MEGGPSKEEWKAASDDELHSPRQADDTIVSRRVRYYDCIYCKRGFTTAQALGGHMNIHRKDRGKARRNPQPPVVEKSDYYSGESYGNYSTYSRTPGSGGRVITGHDDHGSRRPPEHSFYCEGLQLGLGRQQEDEDEKGQDGEDGLDLELRLGYYP